MGYIWVDFILVDRETEVASDLSLDISTFNEFSVNCEVCL